MKKLKFNKQKIVAVTSSRADYYLLKNLLNFFESSKKFDLYIIVTGSHLLKKFGYTYKDIKDDKYKNIIKLPSFNDKNSSFDIVKNFYKTSEKFSKILNKIRPNLVIVLGDRYEILSVASTASVFGTPIAHLHGGEVTNGSQDDNYRHAITKLSNIHFVSSLKCKKRVEQLGEDKANTYVVGSFGLDRIKKIKLYTKERLKKIININFQNNNFLINFHPDTESEKKSINQIKEILKALKNFKNTNLFFTYPNADKYNSAIINLIRRFKERNKNCYLFKSLGDKRYFSLINNIDIVIGNSSSGIIEVPYFKKPSINLGDRQKGREQSKSIINSIIKKKIIVKNIKFALSKKFLKKIKNLKNPYEKNNTALNTFKILSKLSLKKYYYKKFVDLK